MNRRQLLVKGARWGGVAMTALAGLSLRTTPEFAAPPAADLARTPAKGPLRVLSINPRYFTDGSGKAIYLAGAHAWWNFQDTGHRLLSAMDQDPPPVFDYEAYLNFLVAHNHNFFRLWRWEAPKWGEDQPRGAIKYSQPHPWVRSGPGLAHDGKPKFDLTRFNQEYFDRMRARVKAAGDRGIYASIMLFDGVELQYSTSWIFHPFNGANNVNGVYPDPIAGSEETAREHLHLPATGGEDVEGLKTAHVIGTVYTGAGLIYNTLQQTPAGKRALALQEAYVRKVIDTVNDLDNVLYEICNEGGPYSTDWQYHMIDHIHEYEGGKEKQHPVGMTFQWKGGSNDVLYHSPADWISPNSGNSDESYLTEPSGAYHGKVLVSDTDHLCGHTCGDTLWVWKSFCRGLNVLMLDDLSPSPTWQDSSRIAIGQTRQYAERMNLARMVPNDALAETRYCLANTGKEYLIFQPGSKGEFTVNLSDAPGTFAVEWLNINAGTTIVGKPIKGGGSSTFPTPFGGPGVLYLKLIV